MSDVDAKFQCDAMQCTMMDPLNLQCFDTIPCLVNIAVLLLRIYLRSRLLNTVSIMTPREAFSTVLVSDTTNSVHHHPYISPSKVHCNNS